MASPARWENGSALRLRGISSSGLRKAEANKAKREPTGRRTPDEAQNMECGDLSPLFLSEKSHRVGLRKRRQVGTNQSGNKLPHSKVGHPKSEIIVNVELVSLEAVDRLSKNSCGDKSPHNKALTSQRTPNLITPRTFHITRRTIFPRVWPLSICSWALRASGRSNTVWMTGRTAPSSTSLAISVNSAAFGCTKTKA